MNYSSRPRTNQIKRNDWHDSGSIVAGSSSGKANQILSLNQLLCTVLTIKLPSHAQSNERTPKIRLQDLIFRRLATM